MRWLIVAFFIVLLGLGQMLLTRNVPILDLPDLGPAPEFGLIDAQAKQFSSNSLRGKIWVADFIFTSCSSICPTLTANMAKLSRQVPEKVEFVSVSIDPEVDTPRRLSEFAGHYKADFERWHFLTGQPQEIKTLLSQGFKLAGEDDKDMHTNRFVLIDSAGQIRGYFSGLEKDALEKLRLAIDQLLGSGEAK